MKEMEGKKDSCKTKYPDEHNHSMLFVIKKTKHIQHLATWLMFVPVTEGERDREAIFMRPAVHSHLALIHEINPVIHATVGSTLTQQTVDEGLLKPASMRRGEARQGERLQCYHKYLKV